MSWGPWSADPLIWLISALLGTWSAEMVLKRVHFELASIGLPPEAVPSLWVRSFFTQDLSSQLWLRTSSLGLKFSTISDALTTSNRIQNVSTNPPKRCHGFRAVNRENFVKFRQSSRSCHFEIPDFESPKFRSTMYFESTTHTGVTQSTNNREHS